MDDLKLPLFVLCLCFKAIQTSDWTVDVPSSVNGLLGSCVVVPCSYNYPPPQNTPTKFTGMWISDSNGKIYHTDKSKMQQQYQSRTELGDITHKNCSLKIDPLQGDDHGPFYFRIEISGYDSFSYSNNKVSISIKDRPDPIKFSLKEQTKAGETVAASCSVSHSCPASPPVFKWTHSGEEHIQTKQLDHGQWEATSTLTFRPTHTDHNKQIQCTVTYKGGQQQKTSQVLKVTYAPTIKNVSACSLDGDTVKCLCIVESNPPSTVQFLHGDKVLSSKVEKHGLFIIGTLHTDTGSFKSVQCLANNTVGKDHLMLQLPVNSKMQNIFIASGAAAFVVLLMIVVIVKKCRKRPETQPPAINRNIRQAAVPPTYATTKRKDKNEDVWCPDIYANDPVYGNIDDDGDDAIYANV